MPIRREILVLFSLVAQLGLIMAVSIYIGYRVGFWLDQVSGAGMWFTIAGTLLGICSGFYSVYRLVTRVLRQSNDAGEDDG